jgi:hypothetical protein
MMSLIAPSRCLAGSRPPAHAHLSPVPARHHPLLHRRFSQSLLVNEVMIARASTQSNEPPPAPAPPASPPEVAGEAGAALAAAPGPRTDWESLAVQQGFDEWAEERKPWSWRDVDWGEEDAACGEPSGCRRSLMLPGRPGAGRRPCGGPELRAQGSARPAPNPPCPPRRHAGLSALVTLIFGLSIVAFNFLRAFSEHHRQLRFPPGCQPPCTRRSGRPC